MLNGETATVDETATGAIETATRTKGTVTKDPETTALVKIFAQLDALEVGAQSRVLNYLFEKYASRVGR